MGADFRATKDLDMVLLIEALDDSFGEVIWEFIRDGGYAHKQKSTGKDQFYRFEKPSQSGFPTMIELFSRKSDKIKFKFDSTLTPIHVSDAISSLSAILLNDDYYELLVKGKSIVDGLSVLSIEYVLLFKIKAWLDLSERKESGEAIDSKNIKKHRNDIFRLLINIPPTSKVRINAEIEHDLSEFFDKISDENIDLKNLGIKRVKFEDLLERIRGIYSVL